MEGKKGPAGGDGDSGGRGGCCVGDSMCKDSERKR